MIHGGVFEELSVSFPDFHLPWETCKVSFLQVGNLAREGKQEIEIYGHLCLLNDIKYWRSFFLGRKVDVGGRKETIRRNI